MKTAELAVRVRDHVDETIAARPGEEPIAIARAAADAIAEDQLRDVLAEALVDVVRKCLSYRLGRLAPTGRSSADNQPVPTTEERLATTVCVEPGTWKALGNCRAKDLRKMAQWRGRLAARHSAERRRLEHLADALTQSGEHLVRDLDSAAVTAVFSDHMKT